MMVKVDGFLEWKEEKKSDESAPLKRDYNIVFRHLKKRTKLPI